MGNNSHNEEDYLSYFEFTLSAVSISSTLNKSKIQIPFSPCLQSDFFNKVNNTFSKFKIFNMNCPKDKSLLITQGQFTKNFGNF